jgi:uncharacterized membrane protein
MALTTKVGLIFLEVQPVVIILPGPLATDFLGHAHTIRPVLAPMTTLWTGSLDNEFSDATRRKKGMAVASPQ